MKMIESRLEQRGQGGFTLIELLVVIAILAVLGGAVIIGIGAMRGNAEEQVCKTNRETIELAAEAFRVNSPTNAYPAAMSDLTTAVAPAEPLIKSNSIVPANWDITTTPGTAIATAGYDPAALTACNA